MVLLPFLIVTLAIDLTSLFCEWASMHFVLDTLQEMFCRIIHYARVLCNEQWNYMYYDFENYPPFFGY